MSLGNMHIGIMPKDVFLHGSSALPLGLFPVAP